MRSAKLIAQRVLKVSPITQVEIGRRDLKTESAKVIKPSYSPWSSPIVINVKKNEVDVRLWIDSRLTSDLTQLIVYPMTLIKKILRKREGFGTAL